MLVCRKFRNVWICPDVPCLLITGYAETDSISRRPENVPVLVKPFTPEQLSEAIRSVTRPVVPAE